VKSIDTICTVKCNVNYKPIHETKTCKLDPWKTSASWEGDLECEEIVCPAMTVPAHDFTDNIFRIQDDSGKDCYDRKERSIGTMCTVTCDIGYKPTNNLQETTTCSLQSDQTTAAWDQTLACEVMTCTQLTKPNNGKTLTCSKDSLFESECQFTCNDGYKLYGESTLTCVLDTSTPHTVKWDHKVPACIDNCLGNTEDFCLIFGDTKMRNKDAQSYCAGKGGSLVQFETQAEYDFTLDFATEYQTWSEGSGWFKFSFLIDMYREHTDEVYIKGGGSKPGYKKWFPDQPEVSPFYNIAIMTREDRTKDGMWVAYQKTTEYPICQTPARTPATDFCFGENADKVCYIMGDTQVLYADAVTYCEGEGASLVETADESEYKNVVHFARAQIRLTNVDSYYNRHHIWTNMYTEDKKVYLSNGHEAYPQWGKDQPGTMAGSMQVSILFSDGREDDGYNFRGIEKQHFPVCQKPARTKETEYCYGTSPKTCLTMDETQLLHAAAVTHCTNKGAGWKLVEVADEAKYIAVLHYARAYSRSISNADWKQGTFWTNMKATSSTDVKIVGSGSPGYIKWVGDPNSVRFNRVRNIAIIYQRNALKAYQGMINMKVDAQSYSAMCEKTVI